MNRAYGNIRLWEIYERLRKIYGNCFVSSTVFPLTIYIKGNLY